MRWAQAGVLLIDPELMPDNCSECTSLKSVSQQVASIKSPAETRTGQKGSEPRADFFLTLSCSDSDLMMCELFYSFMV